MEVPEPVIGSTDTDDVAAVAVSALSNTTTTPQVDNGSAAVTITDVQLSAETLADLQAEDVNNPVPAVDRKRKRADEEEDNAVSRSTVVAEEDRSFHVTSAAPKPALVIADEMADFIVADDDEEDETVLHGGGGDDDSVFEPCSSEDEDDGDDDGDETPTDAASDNDLPPTPTKKKAKAKKPKKVVIDSDDEEDDEEEDDEDEEEEPVRPKSTNVFSPDALLSVASGTESKQSSAAAGANIKTVCDLDANNVLPEGRRRQRRTVTRYVDEDYGKLMFKDVPSDEVEKVFDESDPWFHQKFVDTGVEEPSDDDEEEDDEDGGESEDDNMDVDEA